MHIEKKKHVDRAAFEKIRRIAPGLSEANRIKNNDNREAALVPEEVCFKLTNRCNLRCDHCYQWREGGYHHQLPAESRNIDLPLKIIKKVLHATQKKNSILYLWGGEPLMYKNWSSLIHLLEADTRWTSICTNGTLIDKRIESLRGISDKLELSISVDGFQEEHDAIRGRDSFQKTMSALDLLVKEKKKGNYRGEITINTVISDTLLPHIMSFLQYLQEKGIETAYLSMPWFLSEKACRNMDQYFRQHFDDMSLPAKPSWYAYKYRISSYQVTLLTDIMKKIGDHDWHMKIRYNPRLNPSDLHDFINGSSTPAMKKKCCNAIFSRMDVFPTGEVISCKFFQELSMGNLTADDVEQIWHGDKFRRFRRTIDTYGLMPVCAKCNLLYNRGF